MTKKQLIFIHGGEAFADEESWLEFLELLEVDPYEESNKRWKHSLFENLGDEWEVFMPEMPNKLNAKYKEWKIWFEKYIPFLRDGVVLLGHSLGAMFLARYMSENELPVHVSKIFLMSGAFTRDDKVEGGGQCEYFYMHLDNCDKLNHAAEKIYIVHSKDDPVVPYEHALLFQKHLPSAELVSFEDYGHFLQEDFPEIVELIKA